MSPLYRTSLLAGVCGLAAMSLGQMPKTHCPLVGHDVVHLPNQPVPNRHHFKGTRSNALVLYDSTTSFGWAGDLYGQMLANYLSHFNLNVTLEPVESYQRGQLSQFGSGYYLGFVYQDPLPASFLADVMSDSKPFVWCGFNLWELAWNSDGSTNTAFVNKTGISFSGLDETGYSQVVYNGTSLNKDQLVPTEGSVQIVNPQLASVAASSVSTSGSSIPYIVNAGGNFWYIADNPFMDYDNTHLQDRLIAVGDVLHTVLGSNHPVNHRAFIRIEDVSAYSDPKQLCAIADTLAANNVPFVVCVIPDWIDPKGVYFNGVPTELPMNKSPEFVLALWYMQMKGGQIIMHGDTHQYSNVDNAWTGVSADDFEFWRVGLDSTGAVQYLGQIPEDSATWVHQRIMHGLGLMNSCGFFPTGWNTPHYGASPVDYDEFANDFQYSLCREMVFSNESAGGTMNYLNEFSPFCFVDDHGMFRLPETCGYVAPSGILGGPSTLPQDLINRAQANLACRDGWAGCYYHWFLGTTYLQQLVQGIKGLGYKFVNPSVHIDDFSGDFG